MSVDSSEMKTGGERSEYNLPAAQMEDELEFLTSHVLSLEAERSEQKASLEAKEKQIAQLQNQAAEMNEQNVALKAQVEKQQQEIANLLEANTNAEHSTVKALSRRLSESERKRRGHVLHIDALTERTETLDATVRQLRWNVRECQMEIVGHTEHIEDLCDDMEKQEEIYLSVQCQLKSDLTNTQMKEKRAQQINRENNEIIRTQILQIVSLTNDNARLTKLVEKHEASNTKLESRQECLEEENKKLSSENLSLRSKIEEAQKRMSEYDELNSTQQFKITKLEILVAELHEKLDECKKTSVELQQQLDSKKEEETFKPLETNDLRALGDCFTPVAPDELKAANEQLVSEIPSLMEDVGQLRLIADSLEEETNTKKQNRDQKDQGDSSVSGRGSQAEPSQLRTDGSEKACGAFKGICSNVAKAAAKAAPYCGGLALIAGIGYFYLPW